MSTQVSCSELHQSDRHFCADSSRQGTLLATGGETGCITIYTRQSASDQWTAACTMQAHQAPVVQVALAPFGNIIASTDGFDIHLWRLIANESGEPQWRQQAALTTEGGVAVLRFTANADGTLWLASAANNGSIRIFQPSSADVDCSWRLLSVVGSGLHGSSLDIHNSAPAVSVAWKPSLHSDGQQGVPAMLVVGTSLGGAAVWWHDCRHGTWHRGPRLRTRQSSGEEEVVAVAWAPPNGRPAHLVAVAHDSSVVIWHLSGPVDELQEDNVAHLTTSGQVEQLEFNSTGSWLAVSVQGGTVQLFRPLLDGSWHLLTEIQGEAISTEAETT